MGNFGPKTEAGLIKYQKANDLYPTGLVDYDTQTELCNLFSGLNTAKPKAAVTTSTTKSSINTLKVSCYASPNPVKINQNVTFYASVSGGTGTYQYE